MCILADSRQHLARIMCSSRSALDSLSGLIDIYFPDFVRQPHQPSSTLYVRGLDDDAKMDATAARGEALRWLRSAQAAKR